MSLSAKLPLNGPIRRGAAPGDIGLGDVASADGAPEALGFAALATDLDGFEAVFDAARRDEVAWLAYANVKQLGSDLHRALPCKQLPAGVRPVRLQSLNDVWSAFRLRPS